MEVIISWVAAVVSVGSLIVSVYTVVWTRLHDRRQATLEAVNRLQAEVFDELNKCSPSKIEKECSDIHSAEYKKIGGYMSRINHFAVGAFQKIYDKKTFYKLAHGYFDGDTMKKKLFKIIEIKNSNKKNEETYYEATRNLLEWMDKYGEKNKKRKS